jgi:hypothetical protein
MSRPATPQDAEVILKLYDLRREAVMREARRFLVEFDPKSVDDLVALSMSFGTKEQAYLRQVVGYWGMAASLVSRGALNRELAVDNFQEMFFVYAKLEPFLQGFREKMGMPQFAHQIQQFVDGSPEARQRVDEMKKMQADMARRRTEAAVGAR